MDFLGAVLTVLVILCCMMPHVLGEWLAAVHHFYRKKMKEFGHGD